METITFGLLKRLQQDFRIGTAHISLMMAILKLNEEQQKDGFVSVKGYILRKCSKINSKSTYHKCLRELQVSGYIGYSPCFNRYEPSRIKILKVEKIAEYGIGLNHKRRFAKIADADRK